MSSRIGVLVVHEDLTLCKKLECMILRQSDLIWLGSAHSIRDARRLTKRCRPDVALINLVLPDGDGCKLIAELWQQASPVASLVSTILSDEGSVIRAIEAGARGYFLKDGSTADLVKAIRIVHEGGVPLSPQVAKHLLKRISLTSSANEGLTSREVEILRQIAQGSTIGETAEALFISWHTANTHVKNIYAKLAVNNRAQAINQARLRGLI